MGQLNVMNNITFPHLLEKQKMMINQSNIALKCKIYQKIKLVIKSIFLGGYFQMRSLHEESLNSPEGKISQLFQSYDSSDDESEYEKMKQSLPADSPTEDIRAGLKTIQIDPEVDTPPEAAPVVSKTEHTPEKADPGPSVGGPQQQLQKKG